MKAIPVSVASVRTRSRREFAAPLVACSVLLLVSGSGCATIVSGTKETIRFESDPSGASLRIDEATYTTPVEIELSRAKNYYAYFELPGYLPVEFEVIQATNSWMFGNILLGGLIGLAVDSSTGASNDLTPDTVSVVLVPDQPARKEEEPIDGASVDAADSQEVDPPSLSDDVD